MSHKTLLAALAAVLALSLSPARAADIYWTNTLGGNWGDAVNWSPNQVPATNDHAWIVADGTYTVQWIETVARLTAGASVGTQTLTANFYLFVGGIYSFGSNTVLHLGSSGVSGVAGASLLVSGEMTWGGGFSTVIHAPVHVSIAPAGQLKLLGPSDAVLHGVLTNAGRITWSAANFYVGFEGRVYNQPGGIIEMQSDQLLAPADPSPSPVRVIQNAGLFRKTSNSGTTTMATPFVNTGTIEVQSGVVSFQGGGTHNGLLSVSAGATVDFNNGPHTFGAANTNNIAGTFQVSGGATVSVNTNVAVTLPNLTLSGGQIGGGGTWTVNGLVNWTGGSIDDLVFNANGVTTISGAAEKSLTRATFNNAVVLTCNGGNIQHNQSVVNNLPGAVFDVQDDMDFNWSSANPPLSTFNNMGIFRKSAGATNETTLLNFFFRNAGLVEVLGGHLGFIGDTQFRQTAGATLLKGGNLAMGGLNQLRFAGGLVGGNGRLIVNSPYSLVVAGQFSPGLSAGRVEVLGNYIQPAAGSYNVEIGGTNAGANYDQVAVSGYADLHGTINVLSVNGFVPALGDRFEIMKFNGYFGSVTFQGLDITNGIRLLPVFSPTNLVLVATNAPLSVSPRMNLARNGDSLWCWWPLGYGTFNVQSATNLNPPIIWSPVSPAEVNRHIFNANEPMQFFRMVQP